MTEQTLFTFAAAGPLVVTLVALVIVLAFARIQGDDE